jgi:ubiquinone/menaquinone biosynthesis C-methylase UbiE
MSSTGVSIRVSRGDRVWNIQPAEFEAFPFEHDDTLTVLSEPGAATLPKSWADTCIEMAPGHAFRVPPKFEFFDYKGYRIPEHLIALTGAGSETLDIIGRAHIEHLEKFVGIDPGMTFLEIGCGIGRDAFHLTEILNTDGGYIGIDVTRDSIMWAKRHITPKHPNFVFFHLDAFSELYNPFGRYPATHFMLPAPSASIDRIVLTSVFTHMLEDEVLDYMREFARMLKPDGLVYANFFLISDESLKAAETSGHTPWAKDFFHYGNGRYSADPAHPRGAVGYTDEAMRRMISEAGLKLQRPYIKGWWSGLYSDDVAEDGQDAAVLARA